MPVRCTVSLFCDFYLFINKAHTDFTAFFLLLILTPRQPFVVFDVPVFTYMYKRGVMCIKTHVGLHVHKLSVKRNLSLLQSDIH